LDIELLCTQGRLSPSGALGFAKKFRIFSNNVRFSKIGRPLKKRHYFYAGPLMWDLLEVELFA